MNKNCGVFVMIDENTHERMMKMSAVHNSINEKHIT